MNMMETVIPGERANRDFRAKFPDDVMQENLAGQLWFGAEVYNTHSTFATLISLVTMLKMIRNNII